MRTNLTSAQYLRSLPELAKLMPRDAGGTGLSERQLQTKLKSWGIEKTARGWPVVEVLTRAHQELHSDVRGDGSLDDEIKKRKLTLLDLEIDERKGKLKPMSEWLNEVREVAAITKSQLQHFVAWVSAEIRTPEAYKKANELAERTCLLLDEKVQDAVRANGA